MKVESEQQILALVVAPCMWASHGFVGIMTYAAANFNDDRQIEVLRPHDLWPSSDQILSAQFIAFTTG